jgi:hypothetical protein
VIPGAALGIGAILAAVALSRRKDDAPVAGAPPVDVATPNGVVTVGNDGAGTAITQTTGESDTDLLSASSAVEAVKNVGGSIIDTISDGLGLGQPGKPAAAPAQPGKPCTGCAGGKGGGKGAAAPVKSTVGPIWGALLGTSTGTKTPAAESRDFSDSAPSRGLAW